DEAIQLLLNGKTRRCSVCNATETVLLDAALSEDAKKRVFAELAAAGVRVHGVKAELDSLAEGVVEATEEDWTDEYLSFDIAAAIVGGVRGAVEHITTYSAGHTAGTSASDYGVLC